MNSKHLNDEQLEGHVYQMLTDAEREAMDRHLARCPSCRARLDDHAALQRRIHHGLRADLMAVRPSPRPTYAAIARRVQRHRRPTAPRRWLRLLCGAAALAALGVGVLFVPRSLDQPSGAPTMVAETDPLAPRIVYAQSLSPFARPAHTASTSLTARSIDSDSPAGWRGYGGEDCVMGVDQAVARGGGASAYVGQSPSDYLGECFLYQEFKADAYRGGRLRLSGYVKAEDVWGSASLQMTIQGLEYDVLRWDTMADRPVTGTSDWQEVEIILDAPKESVIISLKALLRGQGQMWIDDLQLERVGDDVPVTGGGPSWEPCNLGFEQSASGWYANGRSQDVEMGIDRAVAHGGEASVYIKSRDSNKYRSASWEQDLQLDGYRGERLRLSGYMKKREVDGEVRLGVEIANSTGRLSCSDRMRGNVMNDWRRYQVVVDVPEDSILASIGASLRGTGQLWVDDLQIEIVDRSVPLRGECETATYLYCRQEGPLNLDFEDRIATGEGWFASGTAARSGQYDIWSQGDRAGDEESAGYVRSRVQDPWGFVMLAQSFSPGSYAGDRVRMSARVRSEAVDGWAGLLMWVDGPAGTSSLDNMQHRPFLGTSDWQRHEIVLDVPENSRCISFGVWLDGPGRVWVDDFEFEVTGKGTPTTDLLHCPEEPVDLDFEAQGPLPVVTPPTAEEEPGQPGAWLLAAAGILLLAGAVYGILAWARKRARSRTAPPSR